ncbi:MAG: RNA polymerase sigma-70 factor [Niabella sp.]
MEGSSASFAHLYALLFKRLYHFAFSIIRVPEVAVEVVEDVFLKLWMQRDQLAEIKNLPVYLYVAVKNRALNRLETKAKELHLSGLDHLVPDMASVENDPLTEMISSEMLKRVNHAIENLPPRCKMIFKLVREDGLRYKEVAAILNISVNTIDVQMAAAVKRICEEVGISKNTRSRFFMKKNKKQLLP